jgi:hypothetical protein
MPTGPPKPISERGAAAGGPGASLGPPKPISERGSSREGPEGPDPDTGLLAKLAKDADVIRHTMPAFDHKAILQGYNPQNSVMRTSKPPRNGKQSSLDIKLDNLRGAMCAEMMTFYDARPWNDLCGGRILSKAYNFGAATTGSEDIVPLCGRQASLSCGQGMGVAAQGDGGTSSSAEAIMDCDLVSWRTACLQGADSFNSDTKDPGYNQRLYGLIPSECYCACYDQCTMGQSSVLGAQRTGAQCTLSDLHSGKCKSWGASK